METEILTPFLNRAGEFDPTGWFQLVPKGAFPISRKEGDAVRTYTQVVDDQAVNKIVTAFTNRRAANLAYRMLVDFEHFSHDTSKSSAAACWVTDMEARADGVWAKGEWSDDGEAAIKNRRYRYLSPVWFPRQTQRIDATRFRPVEVNDAGLTNKPNLGEALQPFWNREEEFHGREATTATQTQGNTMKDRLILICGLAATATDEQIVAAVEAFKNRGSEKDALQGKFDTLTRDNEALKNRHNALLTSSVDKTLGEFKGLITEESKEAWKNRLTSDFEGTVALLKGIKTPAAAGTKKPVHKDGKATDTTVASETEDDDSAFLNRATEIAKERKVSESEAQVLAARENPDLYEGYRKQLLGIES
jgi:phage I-like protein